MSDQDKTANVSTGSEQARVPAWRPTFSGSLARYHAECLANVRRRLPAIADALKAAGIAVLRVHYDGCGDSGQIESIIGETAQREVVLLSTVPCVSEQQLFDLFYDIVECRYPGWENDDGACGEFTWRLGQSNFIHIHRARFTDYDTTAEEGL